MIAAADRLAFLLLLLLTFTIPWEKSLVIPGIGTVARLAGSLALVGGVIAATLRRHVRPPNLALGVAAVFVLWSVASRLWSLNVDATVARSLTLLQLLLMAYLVWDLCRSMSQVRLLAGAYVAGAVVASVATVIRYLGREQTYYRRYAAAGFDPNDLGLTLALALPLALWLALRPGAMEWVWRCAALVCAAAVLLTASRTALLCAGTALIAAPVFWPHPHVRARIANFVLVLAFVAGAVALAPKESRERIATIGTEVRTGTLHKRTTIWKAGIQAWKPVKLLGVGAGAYPKAVEPLIGVPGVEGHEYVAHNTFLSVLVETGAVGALLYGSMLAVLLVFAAVQRPPERALWLTVLVVWAIGVTSLTWEHRKAAWILFSMLMAAWSRSFRTAELA